MKYIVSKQLYGVLLISCLLLGASLVFTHTHSNSDRSASLNSALSPVAIDHGYLVDYSNARILVGASHNIFIGKVIAQIGNKERGIGPETQFSVHVISNIKGNLSGTVKVNEQGGYKSGRLYVAEADASSNEDPSSNFLQPGVTYLLATRYNASEDWNTVNSYLGVSDVISRDQSMDDATLLTLANLDSRVQQLKEAYPNEILLKSDVASNDALNSYQSWLAAQEALSSSTANATSSSVVVPEVIPSTINFDSSSSIITPNVDSNTNTTTISIFPTSTLETSTEPSIEGTSTIDMNSSTSTP